MLFCFEDPNFFCQIQRTLSDSACEADFYILVEEFCLSLAKFKGICILGSLKLHSAKKNAECSARTSDFFLKKVEYPARNARLLSNKALALPSRFRPRYWPRPRRRASAWRPRTRRGGTPAAAATRRRGSSSLA